MGSVTAVGYVGFEASDLDAWQDFAENMLGLGATRREDGSLALRMDGRVHRMLITPGDADDLAFTGYDCGDDAGLDAVVAKLEAGGIAVEQGDAELAASRGVRRLACTQDPEGNRVELFVDLAAADTPFESALVPSGFNTGNCGAGHTFLPTTDRAAMIAFYTDIGFLISDYIVQEMAPGVVVDAAFMHCNGRHHSIAFAEMPSPKKMHHFMIEVNDRIDVGCAHDRVQAAGIPLALSLGMHPNDLMFSFYVVTPSGFAIEFGADGRLIDDDTWQVTTYDRLSLWGHHPSAA